jgi:hypothetical protein
MGRSAQLLVSRSRHLDGGVKAWATDHVPPRIRVPACATNLTLGSENTGVE